MRTEKQMYDLVLNFAKNDERIRMVSMEGSRTNENVPKDEFQDYDISYLVNDMESFIKDDGWLDIFGERVIMQKPESMDLFPPSLGNWFSYLMLFKDGNRIDLTLIPIEELNKYLESDRLLKILLDKDNMIKETIIPTDEDYWINSPSHEFYYDCCNEFWWVTTYVVKGLCRDELLYASYHLEEIVRNELLRMIAWRVGLDYGFDFSIGKNNKYLKKYVKKDQWNLLMNTYKLSNNKECLAALFSAIELFRETSKYVGEKLGYDYPDYDENVMDYMDKILLDYGRSICRSFEVKYNKSET